MIYNEDSSVDCCQSPFKTGSTAASVTKASNLQYNVRTRSFIIDTVGVGDPELDESEILGSVRNLIRQVARGVNAVVVVMKMARVPAATRANIYVLNRLFHPEDLKSHGVLVLTHWDVDLGEEEESLKNWIGEDHEMSQMVESFGQVILTNNQIKGRGVYPECREKCLQQLLAFISEKKEKIKARPVNPLELVEDLVLAFGKFLWKRTLSVKELITKLADNVKLPTYCGECAVCLEALEIQHLRQLPCNHEHTIFEKGQMISKVSQQMKKLAKRGYQADFSLYHLVGLACTHLVHARPTKWYREKSAW